MSTRYKLSSISLLALLMLSLCFFTVHNATAQPDQAGSSLQMANTAVNQAFKAVLDAEKAGANITSLLKQLNSADETLALADISFRTGDSGTAAAQADIVLSITQHVTIAAQDAKQKAEVTRQNAFWSTIAITIIGAIVFLFLMLILWRWTKKRYVKSLSLAKPEVIDQ